MRNFINEAVGIRRDAGIGADELDIWGSLMDWWDSLEPMYQYAIMGGAGLVVVILLVAILKPSAKPASAFDVKEIEKLLKLKMMKELAE